MDGILFNLGLPDETLELIIEKAGGRRLRIAKEGSKHNRLFREKRNKRICQKRLTGVTLEELTIEFKLKKRRICEILKENNIQIVEEKKKSLKEEIRLLLNMGYKKTEIARRVGKTRQWVYELIRKEKL